MTGSALLPLLDKFHAARIVVVGDVMLDRFVYGTVERISPEAPIPVMNVEKSVDVPGGAANVARNIATLGARVTLVGVVGDDSTATAFRALLPACPTIEPRLIVDRLRPTSLKTRYVADGQQIMRADNESRSSVSMEIQRLILHELDRSLVDADVVVLSDYAKGALCENVAHSAIDRCRKARKTIVVDPKSDDFSKYRGATVITPNRGELQQASKRMIESERDLAEAGLTFVDQGICDVLVVTRGKDGMSVLGKDGLVQHLPTTARQVFDVSGAGDTVVAAIGLGLAVGGEIMEACALANVAAGIVVGKRGTAGVSTGEIAATLKPWDRRANPLKILTLESAIELARSWREEGKQIAFANGCFDLLHPGHISLLDQARDSADRLIVGLNADLSVRRLKGPDRPVQGEIARATVLAAVKAVDAVVIFAEDTPIRLIEALEPDVLVKGSDYTLDTVVGADFVLQRGGRVLLADVLTGHSTTNTVKKVANS
jgi:D-beta-D-heptose 7-phosphate kinase/D-beta-D-heptose 1-phosphate adenosyltransferase